MPVRDLIYHIKELPGRGEKVRAEQFDEIVGGNALNASIGIVRLGGRALFSGPMGDASETSSEYIFEQLAKEGIDSNVVRMPGDGNAGVQCDDRSVRRTHDRHLPRSKTLECDAARQQRTAAAIARPCSRRTAAPALRPSCASKRAQRKIPVVLDADVVMSMREGLLTIASHIIFSAEALTATAGTHNLEDALRRIAEHDDGRSWR